MPFPLLLTSAALLVAGADASARAGTSGNLRGLQETNGATYTADLAGHELSEAYRASIKADAMTDHLEAFQEAADTSGGNRAAGTPGYTKSLDYVAGQLSEAGYLVQFHEFTAPYYEELTPPELTVLNSPVEITNTMPASSTSTFFDWRGSSSGSVEATVHVINVTGRNYTECMDPDIFEGFPPGNIALVQIGSSDCVYVQYYLAENAFSASASGVILASDRGAYRSKANGKTAGIPVLVASDGLGRSLSNALEEGEVVLRMTVNSTVETRVNKNIIAESTHGDPNQTIMLGAHLDSVFGGPGIQDNGSGSAGVLELALQLKRNGFDKEESLKNKLRFAWWGAEEIGRLGSRAYVSDLFPGELSNLAMYMNMDMIGSPNFVRMILDGDSSNSDREPLPQPGSPMAHIEQTLREYFDGAGLPVQEEPFSGSYKASDHTSFYDAGVPVTDLHTGTATPKTGEQAAIFGGVRGVGMDPCYHKACDTIHNVNVTVMEEMTRAAAHALATYGSKEGDLFSFRDEGATAQVGRSWGRFP